MSNPKTKPVCPQCGSDDMVADACASWNSDTQEWELISTYDSTTCQSCDNETDSPDWVPVDNQP
jgi:hypothetical protein